MAYITIAELRSYLDLKDTDTYTPAFAADTLTLSDVSFRNTLKTGTEVTVSSTTADPPAPLVEGTVYYVIAGADQVIQLATTSALATAGTEITLTDDGTGTHSITREDADTTILTNAIAAAQGYIESQTNRVFEAQTLTRYYDSSARDRWNSRQLDLYGDDLLTVTLLANGDGAGTDTYTSTFAADTLTLATASIYAQLETGTPVTVYSTLGDPPDPLVAGTTYYVILVASPTIQLATTYALAVAGTAVTLTDDGTGTHSIECGGSLISGANYWLTPRNEGPPYHGILLKTDIASYWEWDTDGEVSVSGTWGYSATAPGDVKQATLVLAAYLYRQKDSQVWDTTAIPEAGVITIPAGIPSTVTKVIERYKRYL